MSVRHITIRTVLNGFVVDVGCQTVVIQGGPGELCQQLHQYLSATAQEAGAIEQSWLSTPLAQRVYGGELAAERGVSPATTSCNTVNYPAGNMGDTPIRRR